MNLKKLLIDTQKIVSEAGGYAKKEFQRFQRSNIEYKSNSNDLVSYVDKETEKRLISKLLKLIPKASIIAEENTLPAEKTEITWIIDPIDGTTNFVHGIPLFALSVGLLYQEKLALGIIYNPVSEEMFYATSESPAKLNGKPIQVSSNSKANKGIISIGISPASLINKDKKNKKNREWFFQTLPTLMSRVRGLRALGSAAISLAWVASGRLDAYYERGLNSWDIAAGGLIIRQAGGRVTDFSQKDDFLFQREMVAAGEVYSEFFDLLRSHKLVY